MKIHWTWDALPPDYQKWATRVNALHDAGIHPNGDIHPEAIVIELHGVMPSDVMREVTQDKKSRLPLVRTIVDRELGVVHAAGHPVFVGHPSGLTLIAPEPERALAILKKTPGVAAAHLAPE